MNNQRARSSSDHLRFILSIPAAFIGYIVALLASIAFSYLMCPYLLEDGVVWHEEVFRNPGALGWVHAVVAVGTLLVAMLVAPRSRRRIVFATGVVVLLVALPVLDLAVGSSRPSAPYKLFVLAWRGLGAGVAWILAARLMKVGKGPTRSVIQSDSYCPACRMDVTYELSDGAYCCSRCGRSKSVAERTVKHDQQRARSKRIKTTLKLIGGALFAIFLVMAFSTEPGRMGEAISRGIGLTLLLLVITLAGVAYRWLKPK